MFGDFAKTWKWAVPAFFCVLLAWGAFIILAMGWKDTATLMVMVALLCLAVALTNWWRFMGNEAADIYRKRREAEAITPRGMMLEAAKGVHPETIRLILGDQARRWGLVSGTKSPTGKPYKVLMARPRVTEEFLVYFLRRSNHKTYMAKHGNLSDGDRSWDPQNIVTAYEMYDDLESLLIEEMKATRPFGQTKPGYWLGDWEARSVGLDYGIDIEEWEEGEEAPQITGLDTPLSTTATLRQAQGDARPPHDFGGRNQMPPMIAKAMEGLEQTSQMRAATARLYKTKS